MFVKFFIWPAVVIVLCGNLFACSNNSLAESAQTNQKIIEMSDVKFFAWWWSAEQINKGFDADRPPEKTSYVEMNTWQHDGGEGIIDPNKFDIVFRLDNKTANATNLKIKANVAFQYASYKLMYDEEGNGDSISVKLAEIPWSKDEEVYSSTINLFPASYQEIVVKDFDLRKVINNLNRDDWPWRMKVRIMLEDVNGKEIMSKERELEIVPSD